jgi:hypothetical protein
MLDDKMRSEICSALERGTPMRKVAHLTKMKRQEIQDEMRADPKFRAAVLHARAKCMDELLKKLQEAKQWQAATFLLESLWPERFGRNRKRGATKDDQSEPIDGADLSALTDEEQRQLEFLLAKLDAQETKTPTAIAGEQSPGRAGAD